MDLKHRDTGCLFYNRAFKQQTGTLNYDFGIWIIPSRETEVVAFQIQRSWIQTVQMPESFRLLVVKYLRWYFILQFIHL